MVSFEFSVVQIELENNRTLGANKGAPLDVTVIPNYLIAVCQMVAAAENSSPGF